MLTLIAFCQQPQPRATLSLAAGRTVRLGRARDAQFSTPWDPQISRLHAEIVVAANDITLTRLPGARNAIFVEGSEIESARLTPGQSFVIGGTRFDLTKAGTATPRNLHEFRRFEFNPRALRNVRYEDADKRIEVLTNLPALIRESGVEHDLFVGLTGLLLAGIAPADGVAIVGERDGVLMVLHQERRREADGPLKPSLSLADDALEREQTILHVWDEDTNGNEGYTQDAQFNWAFCSPIRTVTPPRAVYVAGQSTQTVGSDGDPALQAEVKFTEFITEVVGSLLRQSQLERHQSGLRQFFSPPILEALGDDLDTSLLEPRECDVTVLFCDLRGFSHRAEEEAGNLTALLERVSLALEVMTSQILRFGGVTGDFQGDAALGFWGWPIASDEAPLNACRAALAIRRQFAAAKQEPGHPLADFETSIGIAHGRAVAGKIGTREQVKVTVFGPVVNLASRLEAMTRELRVPILVDETLCELVRGRMPRDEGRVRQLLRLIPYGMDQPQIVSELLPPVAEVPHLTDEHIRMFENAVDQFIAGDWNSAWTSLHGMPASDRAQDYLSMLITQHDRSAPEDWDGIVRLKRKSS